MKKLLTAAIAALLMGCTTWQPAPAPEDNTPGYVLGDEIVEVKIGEDGALLSLVNKETGHN